MGNHALFVAFGAFAILPMSQALAQDAATVVWETEGFNQPESVYSDPERGVLYVSNIAGEPLAEDGVGYISRLSPDGAIQEAEWVTGLNAPKGMSLDGSTLYVSDINRLVAIDVDKGEILKTWSAEGAVFLNDTATDGEGRVYVTDMMTNKIHVLDGDTLSVWLESDALMHPNGVKVDGGRLLVTTWGNDMQPDFTTLVPGHVLSIDLATKEISAFGSDEPLGNLDGLEKASDTSWLATDWIAGTLIRVGSDGSHAKVKDLSMGSADLEFLESEGIAVVPFMLDGKVVAYKLE